MNVKMGLAGLLLVVSLFMATVASAEPFENRREELNRYLVEHVLQSIDRNTQYSRSIDQYYREVTGGDSTVYGQMELTDIDFQRPAHALILVYDDITPTRTAEGTRRSKLSEKALYAADAYAHLQLLYLLYDMPDMPSEDLDDEYSWYYLIIEPLETLQILPMEPCPMETENALVWLFYPTGLPGDYRVAAVHFLKHEDGYIRVLAEDIYSSGDKAAKLFKDPQSLRRLIKNDLGALTEASNPEFWAIDEEGLGAMLDFDGLPA